MKVVTKMEGLEGVLATLKSLPPELVSKGGWAGALCCAQGGEHHP